MKICTWNVNSARVRIPHILDWLDAHQPDVLGLQEIKMQTDVFPGDAVKAAGYHYAVDGQKTYNGVALLSRQEPTEITCGIPGYADEQKRFIAATYGDTRIINLYVPNGQTVDSEKYAYKLEWLDALQTHVADALNIYPRLVMFGDFNIAPEDRDVHTPEEWKDRILCSDPERARLQSLVALGLVDVYRQFDQKEKSFSWWDYRAAGFRRNRGLRIDLILASEEMAARCTDSQIDIEPRALEKPSDHAPVWAEFT